MGRWMDPPEAERPHRSLSTTGCPAYKDHDYELTTVYDNRTDHDIDAMTAMRLYVHPIE